MSKYDVNSKELSHISEKDSNSNNFIPKTIEYTLSHQLGRSIVLATDENGHYFLGVYRIIEGNDDKYVNAVFYEPNDPYSILCLYDYFCKNQYSASSQLLRCVSRTDKNKYPVSELEYTIESDAMHKLLSDSTLNYNPDSKEYKNLPPNSLLAFITTDEYSDYQISLEEKFNTAKMFCSEHFDIKSDTVESYQLVTRYIYKNSYFIPVPLAISGGIGIVGVIVALLIMLL